MKTILFVVTACLVLAGCDQAKDAIDDVLVNLNRNGAFGQPSIVISPGWQIDDHGKLAKIYGSEKCPKSFLSSVRRSNCVIIGPDDEVVPVLIGYGEVPHKAAKSELWTVERRGEFPHNSVQLKRPDNSYVMLPHP